MSNVIEYLMLIFRKTLLYFWEIYPLNPCFVSLWDINSLKMVFLMPVEWVTLYRTCLSDVECCLIRDFSDVLMYRSNIILTCECPSLHKKWSFSFSPVNVTKVAGKNLFRRYKTCIIFNTLIDNKASACW